MCSKPKLRMYLMYMFRENFCQWWKAKAGTSVDPTCPKLSEQNS